MRFYKLNGVWQSWDYLHNELGYAEHATRPTVFKSCADATWGENAGNGYYDGDVSDMINGTFWTDADPTGWFDLDGLVWNSETYPADAAPSLLVKDGVASDALVITCNDGNYYLIRAIIDTTAWIPESEVEALGWRSPSFVVVDSTTGKIVSGCNQELTTYELPSVILNNEDGYETYELPSISLAVPKMVIGVPISGPVQSFWFTDEGRDETNDKTFTVVGNPLFDEDGSIARNELYELAVPLSFMQYDGNMFEADSDSDVVRYLPTTSRLTLSIPGDSTTRGKSAWSVQCAKLFVLSYVNEQLPDVQIELPINEVGESGTVITLPTIDGEYESGGKTWKPSAWDIGAFGSSYSLTADTVAHLVFTEVVQYEEITLYMVNGNKRAQNDVTSAFTGNVNSTYCYQLYTDAECTTPWNAYDYSNNYELVYNGVVIGLQKVSDLPSTTVTSGSSLAYILMDTGSLWLASNMTGSGYQQIVFTTIALRIYPKAQQHYAFYKGSTSNSYENGSLSNGNISGLKGKPYISNITQQTVPWGVQDNTLPVRTLQKVLGSAGNELSLTGLDWRDPSLGYNFYQLANNSGSSVSFRTVLFTLSMPTLNAYTTTANSDISVAASGVPLYFGDGSGKIPYDSNYSYRVIGLFKANGDAANETWAVVNDFVIYDDGSGNMAIKRNTNSGVALKRVWCTKTLKPIETTFGAAVTIPAGFEVESVTCSRGYAFASNVTISGTIVSYEISGEKVYFDDTNTALIGISVQPALQIAVLSDASQTVRACISTKSGTTTSRAASASAEYVNTNGFMVKATANFSNSSLGPSVAVDMQSRPVYFNLSDSSGNWLYFCFRVPQTLWQFQNGTFSWLGDTTDSSDLAYWYNGRAVQINLRQI